MKAAAEVRKQVEAALAGRIPSALSIRPLVQPELFSCGVAEVDDALGGGLPLGNIVELAGAASSGRTTLTFAVLAGITQQGERCAYVDASDTLDPSSAAALGVDLRRVLWVRAGKPETTTADVILSSAAPFLWQGTESSHRTCGGRHPREESKNIHQVIGKLFGTEQQRLDIAPRCAEPGRRERIQPVVFVPQTFPPNTPAQSWKEASTRAPWTRLDQALRATDLLLSTGGFRALVLDLGDVQPEQARRVPLATWYRFRLQAEKARALFLLLTRMPCANSCAAVSLHCEHAAVDWQRASDGSPALLQGLSHHVNVQRSRAVPMLSRKPAASARAVWTSFALWSR